MSGTLAAVYKHSTHQSMCIYCDLKQAAKSFITSKQRVEFTKEENSYFINSCKSSLNAFNSTTLQQDQEELLLKISISLTPTEYENHVGS